MSCKLSLLVLLATVAATSSQSVSKFDPTFFGYLDDWLRLVDRSLVTLDPTTNNASLSRQCYQHVQHLVTGARLRRRWALKMFDSMGKPASGIMEASLSYLGFFSECVETYAPTTIITGDEPAAHASAEPSAAVFSGRYCLGSVRLPNATLVELQKLAGLEPAAIASANPRLGVCVPSTCSSRDAQLLASDVLGQLIENATLNIGNCEYRHDEFKSDTAAQAVTIILALFLLPIIISTMYDMCRPPCNQACSSDDLLPCARQRIDTTNSVASLTSVTSTETDANHNIIKPWALTVKKFLASFSLRLNAAKILSTEEGPSSIPVLHGIRVTTMLWIISGHSYSFGMLWLVFRNPQQMQAAPKNIMSQVIANGTFSVDSFFFISGLLVTVICLKEMDRRRGKLNLVFFYIHRYLRMTPLMMALIAFCATLLRYTGEGPGWRDSIVMYDGWCKDNWWINSLYLHNFINTNNMCLSHSWYSASDMQMYLVAPAILIPLFKRPKLGLLIMGTVWAASVSFTFALTLKRHYPAVPYISNIIPQSVVDEYYAAIYIKPYTRIGPYLVGMFLGYVLFVSKGKTHLTKLQVRVGWTISTIAFLAILFAMVPANRGHAPSDAFAAVYSSMARSVWGLCLAWVVYACIAGHGGFVAKMLSIKAFIPISRLTYAAYLIHPVVMAWFYGSRQATFEFSHLFMMYLTIGNIVITYGIAFLLSVVFESPIMALERLFIRR